MSSAAIKTTVKQKILNLANVVWVLGFLFLGNMIQIAFQHSDPHPSVMSLSFYYYMTLPSLFFVLPHHPPIPPSPPCRMDPFQLSSVQQLVPQGITDPGWALNKSQINVLIQLLTLKHLQQPFTSFRRWMLLNRAKQSKYYHEHPNPEHYRWEFLDNWQFNLFKYRDLFCNYKTIVIFVCISSI